MVWGEVATAAVQEVFYDATATGVSIAVVDTAGVVAGTPRAADIATAVAASGTRLHGVPSHHMRNMH